MHKPSACTLNWTQFFILVSSYLLVCFKLIVKFRWKWQGAALLRSGFSHLKWLQKVYGVIIVEVRWWQKHNGPINDRTWHWLSCYHSGSSTDKNIDAMAKNSQRCLVLAISSSLSWWGCFQMWIERRKKMHVEYVGDICFQFTLGQHFDEMMHFSNSYIPITDELNLGLFFQQTSSVEVVAWPAKLAHKHQQTHKAAQSATAWVSQLTF